MSFTTFFDGIRIRYLKGQPLNYPDDNKFLWTEIGMISLVHFVSSNLTFINISSRVPICLGVLYVSTTFLLDQLRSWLLVSIPLKGSK